MSTSRPSVGAKIIRAECLEQQDVVRFRADDTYSRLWRPRKDPSDPPTAARRKGWISISPYGADDTDAWFHVYRVMYDGQGGDGDTEMAELSKTLHEKYVLVCVGTEKPENGNGDYPDRYLALHSHDLVTIQLITEPA